jgi:hypothetical protein
MNSWNDPRARELKRLQLALTTFALQLDAFELRTDSVLRSIGRSGDSGDDGPIPNLAPRFSEEGKNAGQ